MLKKNRYVFRRGYISTLLLTGILLNITQLKTLAQTNELIQGTVVSQEDKIPLPGVIINISGSDKHTVTDANGGFKINANTGSVLLFKMLGYEPASVVITKTGSPLRIEMQIKSTQLDDVVVTALGIERSKKALGYSVDQVDGNSLKKARETNVINSLAGRVAGLTITTGAGGPAGSSKVIIRGSTTITGNNQPLYVIDGVPIDNSNYGQAGEDKYALGFDMGDAISAINPDDIESVSILKGPSASALYGSRAANGVILITTKKGDNSKELGVEVNSTTTFERQSTALNGYQNEFGQGTNQTFNMSDASQARSTLFSSFGARLDPGLSGVSFDGKIRPYALVKNNISGFFQTGSTYTNTISLSNATEKSSFRLSGSDLRNNDIVPTSKLKRNTFNLNANSNLSNKLAVAVGAFYIKENVNNRPALADNPGNIGTNLIGLARNVDQAIFKESYKDSQGRYIEWGGGEYRLNPYWIINEMSNVTKKERLRASVQSKYTFSPLFNLQERIATDITYLDFSNYTPPTTPGALSGLLDVTKKRYNTTEGDLLLSLSKDISPAINLTGRLGTSFSRISSDGNIMKYLNMMSPGIISANSFSDKSVVDEVYAKHTNSAYAYGGMNFKNYWFVEATLRRDASSTLPTKNNTYTYPSVSSSFVFTDAFKMPTNILSFGKLRFAASEVGNDTDPYQLDLYYNLNPLPFRGSSVGGLSNQILPNADLKPTRTRSIEIGTELRFLQDRIGLDVTAYTQKSRDQINLVSAAASTGYASAIVNAGTVGNKGIEATLNTKPIKKKDFQWNLDFNFARNVNTVESLAADVPYLTLSEARWLNVAVVAMPGQDYGSILGYDYQRDPKGNIILDPVSLQGIPTAERVLLGKGLYSWTGGIVNGINYKNFSLTALIDIKQGAQIFSMTNYFAAFRGSDIKTLEGRDAFIQSEEERISQGIGSADWQALGNARGYVPKGVIQTGTDTNGDPVYEQNTKSIDPSAYWTGIYTDGNGIASPFIYDASYVKVRELSFSYRIPKQLLSKLNIKDATLTVVSRNPFTLFSNVPNVDPESNYNNGNGQGFEYGSLPSRRSWGLNLNFRF